MSRGFFLFAASELNWLVRFLGLQITTKMPRARLTYTRPPRSFCVVDMMVWVDCFDAVVDVDEMCFRSRVC